MEPRSWKWIQVAAVAVAAAIGLGVALWYQNQPVGDALPVSAALPKRKTVLHPFHPDVIPDIAPAAPDATAAGATAASSSSPAASAPSQSPANPWQQTAVDPGVHLRTSPLPGTATPDAAPSVAPPPDAAAVGVSGPAPFTALPGVPASSPSSSSVSPFVTTAPPAGVAPSVTAGATPGL